MLRTLLWIIGVVWLSVTIAFLLLRVLPGNSVEAVLIQGGASQERIDSVRQNLKLDASIITQYGDYMIGLLRGDLGYSLYTGRPASRVIGERAGTTLSLVMSAMVLATVVGISVGIVAASRTWPGRMARFWIDLGFGVPIYWSATLAILLFVVILDWLPAYEQRTLAGSVLPITVLAFHTSSAIGQVMRSMIEEYQVAQFVWAARSKGLSEQVIMWRHVLPNALPPVVSVIALQIGFLLGGTVMIETIFLRNGLGRLLLDSVINRDMVVVQGIVVLSAVAYALLYLLSNFINTMLDPRLRR